MTLVATSQAVPTYYSTPSPSPSVSPSPVWSVHSSTPSNAVSSVASKLKEFLSPGLLPRPTLSSSTAVPAVPISDGMVELISRGRTDCPVSFHIPTSCSSTTTLSSNHVEPPLPPPPPPPQPSVPSFTNRPPQPPCHTSNALPTALTSTPLPIEKRQNPRRTKRLVVSAGDPQSCPAADGCGLPPVPALQRQADRKVNFVENLVDSAAQIVETIWKPPKHLRATTTAQPASSTNAPQKDPVLPLRTFIQETLRRSRTSYSTLQVALYYLIVIRPHLPAMDCDVSELEPEEAQLVRAKQCGRRMFLAALILASKYLQDRNYSARGWSKISGLNTSEININEMAFLKAVDWKLHISDMVFQRWTDLVLKYTSAPSASPVSPTRSSPWKDEEERKTAWCELIMRLSPDLHEAEEQLPAVEKSSPRVRKQPLPSPSPSERSGKRIRCGWELDGAFDGHLGVAQGVR